MIFKKIIYVFLLGLTKLVKLTGKIFFKDVEVFFRRYPLLTMPPEMLWHYLGVVIKEMLAYHFAKRPLFFKLAFFFAVILSFSVIGLTAIAAYQQAQILQIQLKHFSQSLTRQVANELKAPLLLNNPNEINVIASALLQEKTVRRLTVYDNHHVVIKTYSNDSVALFSERSVFAETKKLTQWQNLIFNELDYPLHDRQPIKQDALLLGYVELEFDYSDLAAKQFLAWQSLLIISLSGLFAIALMAAFYLSGVLFKFLNQLSISQEKSQHINAGQDKHNPKNKHRRQDELEAFMESMNSLNKGMLQKEKVQSIFSRYVSAQVANQVLQDLENIESVKLGGEHMMASVFFADIVGFTSLSETLSPQEISELLNVYFSKIIQAVKFCHGRVDKFIGDCAMVVFGVPEKNPQHAFHCIACGWMILQLVNRLNDEREKQGLVTVEFRIGANSGMMLAGNMGSAERMEYTVVGDSVNLASRLSGSGEPGELIITEDVFVEQGLEGLVLTEVKDLIKLRGKKLPVKILNVKDITSPFKAEMLNEIPRIIAAETAS